MREQLERFALYEYNSKKFIHCYICPDYEIIYAKKNKDIYLWTTQEAASKSKKEIESKQPLLDLRVVGLYSYFDYEVRYE